MIYLTFLSIVAIGLLAAKALHYNGVAWKLFYSGRVVEIKSAEFKRNCCLIAASAIICCWILNFITLFLR